MYAWFAFIGSTEMLLIGRPGEFVASVSILLNVTVVCGSASAFFETKTRPKVVAAHNVLLSLGARDTQPTRPPLRKFPYGQPGFAVEHVSRPPEFGLPSFTQSPHVYVGGKSPVNSLQCDSKVAKSGPTPSVFVHHTWFRPQYIVPCTVGSAMIGK